MRHLAVLRQLREQPLWRLLAATNAPAYVSLMQSLLFESDKTLPASALHERLARALEDLRATGEDLPQTAQGYVAEWLRQGWLTRRLPAGASEEEYELSVGAADALRFLATMAAPRVTATESRLAAVIQQLTRLAEETDGNRANRVAALLAERERIDREIEAVRQGKVKTLPDERALERAREIIALTDELAADFRRVRDDFDKLNRGLRQSLMENEGSRGDVLEALFAGVDLIGETDAGRTFSAFWRLLTDPVQSEALFEALEAVVSRPFARQLDHGERKFLLNLTGTLMDEGSNVHEVLQHFARSLKSFVQSREFQEQRRLHSLLKQANQAALAAKDAVRPNLPIGYDLALTSSRIRSVAQWRLYDADARVTDTAMPRAAPSEISLEAIGELVRQSEIDFRGLRNNIRAMLERHTQASIGQLLEAYPAAQGLGSVVGYVALGAKHGEVTGEAELVEWRGGDDAVRRARVPTIYFMRERYGEFLD
ncbi:MAG TPA: DUF3375 domain-containing protein [Burkholderiaceae bacterium]